jgi:hypothetical protein
MRTALSQIRIVIAHCALFGAIIFLVSARTKDSPLTDDESSPFELIQRLDASDVQWSVDERGIGHVKVVAEAASILMIPEPPFKELIAVTDDAGRFVAAHVVLCMLTGRYSCCAEQREDGWLLHYGTLQVMVGHGADRPHGDRVFLPTPEEQRYRIARKWSLNNDGDFVAELQRRYRALRALPHVPNLGLRLMRRSRSVVDEIRNEHVVWMHEKYWLPSPILEVAKADDGSTKPSIEALLDALNDPKRFVAAHIWLCQEFQREEICVETTPSGYAANYNGLRVDVDAEFSPKGQKAFRWLINYPNAEKQRDLLVKRWQTVHAREAQP